MRWPGLHSLWLLAPLLCSASTALAQPRFDAQRFLPPPGPLRGATLPDPTPLSHGRVQLGVYGSHGHELVSAQEVAGDVALTDLSRLDVAAAVGLFDGVELGVDVPLSLARFGGDGERRQRSGLSDLRSTAKVSLLRGDFALAALVDVLWPTATGDYPFGDPAIRFAPGLSALLRLGEVRLATALSYWFRHRRTLGDVQVDDALRITPVIEWQLAAPIAAFAELQMELPTLSVATPQATAGELLGGVIVALGDRWVVRAGAGSGLVPFADGYAAPAFRAFASASITLDAFACATGPEDLDGFRDDDGCADPDNDHDLIPDTEDLCPDEAEDLDGFLDDDGCPDLDDDADGIADSRDLCPRLTEDRDGFRDDDGCPEPDNDEDGVADGYDACATEPEDLDHYQDGDGCPEAGPNAATVVVAENRILVSERIYFELDREVIRAVSVPVLEELAGAIQALPQGQRVIVVGHTDNRGHAAHNLDLSFRRARAISEFLQSRGVAKERLSYEGRGGAEPIAPNDSPEGRALNRRVEFRIAATPGAH